VYVRSQLQRSRHREHKLHFGPLLSENNPLAAGLSTAGDLGPGSLLALLDSLVDLELYMPVKEHWARWTGGPELIVASAMRDHEIPVAYNLQGSPVLLPSAEQPPPTPTLAIVPTETDFSHPPSEPQLGPCPLVAAGGTACDPGGGGLPAPQCPPTTTACMKFSYIPGDWEGFLMGDPEFEVHSFTRPLSSNSASMYRCAGEHAPNAASVYDQNSASWSGAVELLSDADFQTITTNQDRLIIQVWEDDKDACVVRKDQQWLRAAGGAVLSYFGFAFFAGILAQPELGCSSECWLFIIATKPTLQAVFEAFQNDDYVGQLVPIELTGARYTDANHVIVNEKGRIIGRVFIDGVVHLPPPPPAQFTVAIAGPRVTRPGETCTWGTVVQGAPGAVSYTWFRDRIMVGTGSTYTGAVGNGAFDLQVEAASGEQAAGAFVTVTTSSSGTACS
jgi:hypothetical protein